MPWPRGEVRLLACRGSLPHTARAVSECQPRIGQQAGNTRSPPRRGLVHSYRCALHLAGERKHRGKRFYGDSGMLAGADATTAGDDCSA